jgi:hypothetical protein
MRAEASLFFLNPLTAGILHPFAGICFIGNLQRTTLSDKFGGRSLLLGNRCVYGFAVL